MKGLALSCVLFCGLALVLVYAATNGVGMRAPSFIPTLRGATADRRPQVIEGQPVVDIERGVAAQPSAMPKPEVTVTRISRKRRHAAPKVATKDSPAAAEVQPKAAPALPQPSAEKPKPKIEERPAPVQKEPEPVKQEPVVHPRDVSDSGPLTDADAEWKRQTLERWRREAEEHRDGASRSTITTTKPGQEPELKDTPAEGLYPAHDKKKKLEKRKKKRHRFLFIRW